MKSQLIACFWATLKLSNNLTTIPHIHSRYDLDTCTNIYVGFSLVFWWCKQSYIFWWVPDTPTAIHLAKGRVAQWLGSVTFEHTVVSWNPAVGYLLWPWASHFTPITLASLRRGVEMGTSVGRDGHCGLFSCCVQKWQHRDTPLGTAMVCGLFHGPSEQG